MDVVGSSKGWTSNAETALNSAVVALTKNARPASAATTSAKGAEVSSKKTRTRLPSSCVECRRKRLRCNRGNPCTSCTKSNTRCVWSDAVPLFDTLAESDSVDLRNQVARLEQLVSYLAASPDERQFFPRDVRTSAQQYCKSAQQPSLNDPSQLSTSTASSLSAKRESDEYRSAAQGSTTAGAAATAALQMPSPDDEPVHFPSSLRPSVHQSSSSSLSSQSPLFRSAASSSVAPEPTIDLRANDLCEALSQLAIRQFVVLDVSGSDSWSPCGGGSGSGAEWIKEAELFVDTMPQRFGITFDLPRSNIPSTLLPLSSLPSTSTTPVVSPLNSALLSRSSISLAEVLRYIPTEEQAHSAFSYFKGYVAWYTGELHLPSFEAQCVSFRSILRLPQSVERDASIDVFFVSTYLAVHATGLSMMPDARAERDGFGVAGSGEKGNMAERWFEGAMCGLSCGRFLDNPSIESIRAVVVISTFCVFMSTGETSGAGMGLLSLAISTAHALALHRDPDRTPYRYTFFEAEERRRLFWSLFKLCILSSSSLGRTWAVLDLNNVDCKLPLDCHDHEIMSAETAAKGLESRSRRGEETAMTSCLVNIKLAVFAKKINDRAFGVRPVAYSTVLEIDAELAIFESSIPSKYVLRLDSLGEVVRATKHVSVTEMRACMIQIYVASQFIRLHRPYLVRSGQDPSCTHSRRQAIKYSKFLLAVYRSPSLCKQKWGGLTYKAISAATVLAIEILAFPAGNEVAAIRATIRSAESQMSAFNDCSSLCRKGSNLLRYLLEKESVMIALREQRREFKRARQQEDFVSAFGGGGPGQLLSKALYHTPSLSSGESASSLIERSKEQHAQQEYRHKSSFSSSLLQQTRYQQPQGRPDLILTSSYPSTSSGASPSSFSLPLQQRVHRPLPASSVGRSSTVPQSHPTSLPLYSSVTDQHQKQQQPLSSEGNASPLSTAYAAPHSSPFSFSSKAGSAPMDWPFLFQVPVDEEGTEAVRMVGHDDDARRIGEGRQSMNPSRMIFAAAAAGGNLAPPPHPLSMMSTMVSGGVDDARYQYEYLTRVDAVYPSPLLAQLQQPQHHQQEKRQDRHAHLPLHRSDSDHLSAYSVAPSHSDSNGYSTTSFDDASFPLLAAATRTIRNNSNDGSKDEAALAYGSHVPLHLLTELPAPPSSILTAATPSSAASSFPGFPLVPSPARSSSSNDDGQPLAFVTYAYPPY